MSTGVEHRECAESLAAFALGALSDAEGTRVSQHLEGCHECRAELDWLRAAVNALPASVPQIDPSPELHRRVMEIVEAEAALMQAAADRPQRLRPPRRPRWPFPVTGVLRAALAIAAACAVVVVAALVATAGGTSTRTLQPQLSGPALAARALVSLQVRGPLATLIVKDLPAPAADHVDEIWVVRGNAAPEPAGSFMLQSGSIQVGRAVRRGDLVLVTVEPGRGTAAPTTTPFIVAKL